MSCWTNSSIIAKEASNLESNSSVLFSTMPSWIKTYVEADKPMV